MAQLKRIQFGNPLLRDKTRLLRPTEIKSPNIQDLITSMKQMLSRKKLGVGLAAPQVGHSISLAIVMIQPTAHRPDIEPFELTIINPEVTETFGRRVQLWEGCISAGSTGKADLFAKVPRYQKVTLKYLDEQGNLHEQTFDGLVAHVVQHEVDHLQGVLFVDRVRDTRTYMTYNEYIKLVRKQQRDAQTKSQET